jgi:hypothetical protein
MMSATTAQGNPMIDVSDSNDETVLPEPKRFLADGGNVYFLHKGRLYTAPIMKDESFGMADAGPVGYQDGISEQNVAYCRAVEAALQLLDIRNDSEGMD